MNTTKSKTAGLEDAAVLAGRLAAIVESSDDAILGEDLQGVVTSWNAGAEQIFGYTAEEMIGTPFVRLLPPERRQEDADILTKIARGERVGHFDTVRVRKDMQRIHVSVTVSPIRDATGRVVGASKVARDITARREAEQRMAWLASFPERNPNPIVEVDAETGAVHYLNFFARQLFPDLPEQRFAHPLLAGIGDMANAMHGGRTNVVRREVAVGKMWYAQTITHIAEQGRVRIYSNDITARRSVTALLAGQRDLLQKIAHAEPLTGTLEDMMRFAEAQCEGMLCSFLLFDEKEQAVRHGAAPSLPEEYNRAIDGARIGPSAGSCGTAAFRREQVIVRDIATDPLWADYRGLAAQHGLAACWSSPVFGNDGKLLGTFAMYFREPREPDPEHLKLIETITQTAAVAIDHAETGEKIHRLNESLERRVADRTREMEEANRELESFSYSVSHDLRAPLRHVLGYVDLLKRAAEGHLPEKAARYLRTISEAAEQMSDLIDDLLSFSRMGRAEMRTGNVALDSLVPQVIAALEMATRGRRIDWEIGPLPEVTGDAAMLRLVLSNLIGNAVKYTGTRDPARIEIGCAEQKDGRALIFIQDNGVGFDMQYAHKLFGVFQRLHRQEEFEGTGIGLATVRRIITRHGGTAQAEGTPEGGARFSFTIGLASPMPEVPTVRTP